jgi:hypothetical protein
MSEVGELCPNYSAKYYEKRYCDLNRPCDWHCTSCIHLQFRNISPVNGKLSVNGKNEK